MKLPELFMTSMKQLLGDEFEEYIKSYESPECSGLRVNTNKIERAVWEEQVNPFSLTSVSWISNGYYYQKDEQPSRDPYYYAGLYYLQEPSAMTPANLLPVTPGDMVLDLCAAPGGKSTELGARLKGDGLLVANDISSSRAKALLKNLELAGIGNLCVTSESPDKLAQVFPEFFDKILVDAPCSGEGMFRRDHALIKVWEERGPEYYAPIQREILSRAVTMLKPGGYLLYSTCTFSAVEDEDAINWLLSECPAMAVRPLPVFAGAVTGIHGEPFLRLFPHRIGGEGHFIALLQKQGEPLKERNAPKPRNDAAKLKKESDFFDFLSIISKKYSDNRLMLKNDAIYYVPEPFSDQWKLRYLRTGLLMGELKRGRFQPSQALAMSLRIEDVRQSISFSHDDERVTRYLRGETVAFEPEEPDMLGWCLICVDNYPLGWAKGTGRTLKNKYYPGWRMK